MNIKPNNSVINRNLNIKCLQINLQRNKRATDHLDEYIAEKTIDIVLIQEPYTIKGKLCGFKSKYKLFYAQNCVRPKAAILVANNKLLPTSITTYINEYSTVILLELKSKTFAFISLYCSPFENIELELRHTQNIINVLKPQNLIISIDSNAHSRVWFSNTDDNRGNILNEFIAQNNLIMLNNNVNTPTYYTPEAESFIDLTLTNLAATPLINQWQVLKTETLSDHRYICFNINDECREIKFKSTVKYSTNNANWEQFSSILKPILNELELKIQYIENEAQINTFVNVFNEALTQVCDQSLPKISTKNRIKCNKWWTQELSLERAKVNTARRRYQRCQTANRNALKLDYIEIKAFYKSKILKQKTKSWNEFVEQSTKDNPWGLIYKIAKNKHKSEIVNELIDSSGQLITDNKRIAETFLKKLFPEDEFERDLQIHIDIRAEVEEEYTQINDLPFTEQEITEVVLAQNAKKCPGEDGFTADIVKNTHLTRVSFLPKLYNKCLDIGVFPDCWKTSIVKVIKKVGKSDYRQTSAYRPISLLSVFAKIFEKLMINRITHYLQTNKLLNNNQYGFTAQRSTDDALHSLKDFIKNAFQKKGFALIIALDAIGAFDHTWWPKILYQLRKKGVPMNLYYLSKSYFHNRYAKLWHQNVEAKRKLTLGCPQGSASGPWFWNIYYDDLELNGDAEDEFLEKFADDTILELFAFTTVDIEAKANQALAKVQKWAESNKLEYNAQKTACVLFTNKLNYIKPKVYLNGENLSVSTSFKHLGLYFDSKLRWTVHAHYLKTKASQVIMNLLSFAKLKYGLNSKALETIYKGAVLPLISYSCSVWIEAIDNECIKKPFEILQRQVALRICKAYRTVSSEAANIISNLMPIDLYLKQTAINYYIKRGINNNLTESYLREHNIDLAYIQKPFKATDLPHYAKRIPVSIISSITDTVIAYTDGSKSGYGVGSGFCILNGDSIIKTSKFKLSNYCSVFQSELFAIFKAIEYINYKVNGINSITIITDSLSALKAISNPSSTTMLVQHIYIEINKARSKNTELSFFWVRGHEGNYGNELADKMAKEGAVAHQRIAYDLMPVSYAKKIIYQKNTQIWNNRWLEASTGATTRKYWPTVYDRHSSKKHFQPNYYLTQLLTNHGKFNEYLARFNLRVDAFCSECTGKLDTAEHITYECPKYEEQRSTLKAKVQELHIDWPCNEAKLISKELFSYFNDFAKNIFN
jgi:ribonuclease HI